LLQVPQLDLIAISQSPRRELSSLVQSTTPCSAMAWCGRALGAAIAAACVVALLLAATASITGAGPLARGLRASVGAAAEASKGSTSPPSSSHAENSSSHAENNSTALSSNASAAKAMKDPSSPHSTATGKTVAPAGVAREGHEQAGGTNAPAGKAAAPVPMLLQGKVPASRILKKGGVNSNQGQLPANNTVKMGGANDTGGGNGNSQRLPASAFNRTKQNQKAAEEQEDAEGQEDTEGPGLFRTSCLCLFDIDRTVTGRQGYTCGGRNAIIRGIYDPAYGGGPLTLSALGIAGAGSTFCGGCKLGFVSAGTGGGRRMRRRLASGFLGGRAGSKWSGPGASSPLVVRCSDSRKAGCAERIRKYYNRRGNNIRRRNVFFFDDKAGNVYGFANSGMNARQVSCNSRDRERGGCGGKPWEIRRSRGIRPCR